MFKNKFIYIMIFMLAMFILIALHPPVAYASRILGITSTPTAIEETPTETPEPSTATPIPPPSETPVEPSATPETPSATPSTATATLVTATITSPSPTSTPITPYPPPPSVTPPTQTATPIITIEPPVSPTPTIPPGFPEPTSTTQPPLLPQTGVFPFDPGGFGLDWLFIFLLFVLIGLVAWVITNLLSAAFVSQTDVRAKQEISQSLSIASSLPEEQHLATAAQSGVAIEGDCAADA